MSGKLRLFRTVLMTSALCVSATQASANDVEIAKSDSHKLHVYSSGKTWCGPRATLRMALDDASPDVANPDGLTDLMGRLSSSINAQCAAATSADISVMNGSNVLGFYHGGSDTGWKFARIAAPAPQPPTLPPTTTPPATSDGGLGAPPAPVPAPVPAPAPQSNLPYREEYLGLFGYQVAHEPALLDDEGVQGWYLAVKHPQEYQRNSVDEFKIRPLYGQSRAELSSYLAGSDPSHVYVMTDNQLSSYDFQKQVFPINKMDKELTYNSPGSVYFYRGGFQAPTYILWGDDLDIIDSIPMSPEEAAQLNKIKTDRWGNLNRSIHVRFLYEISDPPVHDNYNRVRLHAKIVSAVVTDGQNAARVIYTFPADSIAGVIAKHKAEREAAAKAAADKAALLAEQQRQQQLQLQRQQLLAQRDTVVQQLTSGNAALRVGQLLPEASSGLLSPPIMSIRQARWTAIEQRTITAGQEYSPNPFVWGNNYPAVTQSSQVRLLVHTSGSGSENVKTEWPGLLLLSVKPGAENLASDSWYVVQGKIKIQDGDDAIPPASLLVEKSYKCQQPKCAEANDVQKLVDLEISALMPKTAGTGN